MVGPGLAFQEIFRIRTRGIIEAMTLTLWLVGFIVGGGPGRFRRRKIQFVGEFILFRRGRQIWLYAPGYRSPF
jgi:hypothetical protein